MSSAQQGNATFSIGDVNDIVARQTQSALLLQNVVHGIVLTKPQIRLWWLAAPMNSLWAYEPLERLWSSYCITAAGLLD